jgi:predicted membrane channel-forming protein YqfA (hemolysin III family)
VVPVRTLAGLSKVLWVVIIGVVGLYAFFILMGALSPADHVLITAGVVALAVALAVHLVRVRRAMHEPGHEAELRELHKMRETRGF